MNPLFLFALSGLVAGALSFTVLSDDLANPRTPRGTEHEADVVRFAAESASRAHQAASSDTRAHGHRRPGLRGWRTVPVVDAERVSISTPEASGCRCPIADGVVFASFRGSSGRCPVHGGVDHLNDDLRSAVERVFAAGRARLDDLYQTPNDAYERWRDVGRSVGFERTFLPGTAETFGEAAARITERAADDAAVLVDASSRDLVRTWAMEALRQNRPPQSSSEESQGRIVCFRVGYLVPDAG